LALRRPLSRLSVIVILRRSFSRGPQGGNDHGRIEHIWGPRTPFARGERWPVRVDLKPADALTEANVDRWVQSVCVLCSNGCGTST